MAMQVSPLWHPPRNLHQLAAINPLQVPQEMLAAVGGGGAKVRSLVLPDPLHLSVCRALESGSSGNSLRVEGYTTILG